MAEDETLREGDSWTGPRLEGPGSRIGAYLLVRRIGEGGFGVVFEAEQEQPVRRRVALKILKLGMDTQEVIARFDAERQALAMMEHPNIARVFDAGATDTGRPYFVMEFVEGVPIAQYCDENRIDLHGRLLLFEQVCAAVQHAHGKGVIHRDLKPGNVLVSTQDGKPATKVIDFGIAKATSGNLTEKTLATGLNQVIGTLQYMSPEQAEGGADIDTRTDIYSLGVILYELLAGSTPINAASLRDAAFAEIQRMIREDEPARPSARLAQDSSNLARIAARRGSEPRKLARSVTGELDWIVMKAIEKDRSRRYETANGLAMDVRRYLSGEPVLAAPPSASYRVQKFVRRHKGAVAAGCSVALALMVGVVAFAWQARIAQARADELQQVAAFQAEMLGQIDPNASGVQLSRDVLSRVDAALKAGGPDEADDRRARAEAFAALWRKVNATDVAAAQIDGTILQPAIKAVERKFAGQPLVQASLWQTLADVYVTLGDFESALPLQDKSLSTRRRLLGATAPATLESANSKAVLLTYAGDFDAAAPLFEQVLADRLENSGPAHVATLATMADYAELLRAQGKFELAEKYARQALEGRRRLLGPDDRQTLDSISNLGLVLDDAGRQDDAEPYEKEAMDRSRKVLGDDDPATLASIDNYSGLKFSQGDLEAAVRYQSEVLARKRRVLGEEHPDTITSINNLAVMKAQEGRHAEAEALYRESVEKTRRTVGDDHPDALLLLSNFGSFLADRGKLAEAQSLLAESLAGLRREVGDAHPRTLNGAGFLAELMVRQGNYAEAERLVREFEPTARKVFAGPKLKYLPALLTALGNAQSGQRKFAAAESTLLEAHAMAVETRHSRHKVVITATRSMIKLYAAWAGHEEQRSQWEARLDAMRAEEKAERDAQAKAKTAP